jgi:hypothetical protein
VPCRAPSEAVRLGADAVGYTLYVGTPGQERDFAQYLRVREDAERFGMLVVRSAGRSLLLVSGGEHAGEEAMLEKARGRARALTRPGRVARGCAAPSSCPNAGKLSPGLHRLTYHEASEMTVSTKRSVLRRPRVSACCHPGCRPGHSSAG